MFWQRLRTALAHLRGIEEASAKTTNVASTPKGPAVHLNNPDQVNQLLLKLHYQHLMKQGLALPGFEEVQFRAHSQSGEDGLLLLVFAVIGTTNRRCVEICAGDGIECNTANLIINHGWTGLLVDGNKARLERGRKFYSQCQDTRIWPPYLQQHWVTRENINDILASQNYMGEIDLLSLDMDGNDYWIWQAIDIIDPRVVILEYQSAWGPDERLTQRYQEDFDFQTVKAPPVLPRCGASLGAFVSLAREKGYRLVGCNHLCYNAVFVKQGIGEEHFPEIPAGACFDHDMQVYRMAVLAQKRHLVPDIWVEV
jgi:hypothetical protein